MNFIRQYYTLTKPGIIKGNLLTATAGYFLAGGRNIDFLTLLAILVGLGLVVASACVFNNYLDRDIDTHMDRTKKRAMAAREISSSAAITFACILGILGALILLLYTTSLALILAILGLLSYVLVYTPLKRKTPRATEIGSIPGAIPPLVGYTAFTGSLDVTAMSLFLLLVFWQIPHFYAIALFRLKDYHAATIPLHPLVKGSARTKRLVLYYILMYIITCLVIAVISQAGIAFGLMAITSGVAWFLVATNNYSTLSEYEWGKKVFIYSLPVLSLACLGLILGSWLN